MAFLTKEQILAADDRRYEVVDVPEWGGTVRLASMTAKDRAEFDEVKAENKDSIRLMPLLLVSCLVDEQGERIFALDDVPAFLSRSPRVLVDLFSKAIDLNAMSKESIDRLSGNSQSGQSGNSPSASLSLLAAQT